MGNIERWQLLPREAVQEAVKPRAMLPENSEEIVEDVLCAAIPHLDRGAVCLDEETLADLDRRAAVSGYDRAGYLRWVLTGSRP